MSRAVQLELGAVMRRLERAAAFLELQGVEDVAISMSEEIQDRARRCGMMPIHPARRTLTATGPRVTELFGSPVGYFRL